jgi:hypothetical protein
MTTGRSKLVSAFDDMLDASRSRFNALDRNLGARPHGDAGASSRVTRTPSTSPEPTSTTTPRSIPPGRMRLQARFGDRWRHDVMERRLEGNEAIVLCKVTVDDQVVQTQFGRAAVGGASSRSSAGGVAFSIASPATTGLDREDEAYRLAVEDALEKCSRILQSNPG